ncbi:DUF6078 family protein [uncultured Parabacteroides sp.]|uniref:DUF6078 family protein n=1 Tax=uncultured Parabacteroides sp. TaxID=512312 RepID=UPI0026019BF8|nr:DUF6078 family protein [uncultured Parabacteroides sp.]
MEEKLDNATIPNQYTLCLDRQCPKASTCLRQLAEQSMPDETAYWQIISPRHLASLKGTCPYYRPNKKVRYATGFVNLLESLPHKQMLTVIPVLMRHFSRRTYYRVRKGERPLSPSEQQVVLNVLKRCGVKEAKDFDAYFEEYDW